MYHVVLYSNVSSKGWYNVPWPVLEMVFESVQQKHLDNKLFDQQVVNFVQKTSTVPIFGL